jgi:hypothetical protein
LRGTAWIEDHELDIYFVYPDEAAPQMIGAITVVGREIGETKYTWSTGDENAPNAVASSESEAVAAILAARG